MATGQTLLDTMELLNQELQLQAAETDVVRGLVALNRAQDYFESLASQRAGIVNPAAATGTVTTTVSTEKTAYPTGVLRIDRLQFIDATTSLPTWDLFNTKLTGSHRRGVRWTNLVSSVTGGTGAPRGYWTDSVSIYWIPLPDATHTVRWYGFKSADDITAGGTFAWPDIAILPFASFAVALLSIGVGDAAQDWTGLAGSTFNQVIDSMANGDKDFAPGFEYNYTHIT